MNAIDTNVLVYSLDRSFPVKRAKARNLLRQLRSGTVQTVLLRQVAGEFLRQLRTWQYQGQLTRLQVLRVHGSISQLFHADDALARGARSCSRPRGLLQPVALGQHATRRLHRSSHQYALYGRHGVADDHQRYSVGKSVRVMSTGLVHVFTARSVLL